MTLNFQIITSKDAIDLRREWKDSPKINNRDQIETFEGKEYQIIQKEKQRGLVEIISKIALGVFLVAITLFSALSCPWVQDLFATKDIKRFGILLPKGEQQADQLPKVECKVDNLFKSVHSGKLETFKIKAEMDLKTREHFFELQKTEGYNPKAPVLSKSAFVPDHFVEHLMRNKKDSALGVKYCNGDAITNMEGALHTFLTPLAKINMTGDYAWNGFHSINLFGNNQVRPVILSAAIQPDFEKATVMAALTKLEYAPVIGKPLPDDFQILTPTQKMNEAERTAYDHAIRSHLIYHLTAKHLLPSIYELHPGIMLPLENAPKVLTKAIENNESISKLCQMYLNGKDAPLSLEMLFNSYVEQLKNELKVLEKAAPQGYVYTIDPPSIFAAYLGGDATFLNRLQILAFKAVNQSTPLQNLKMIGFNDYADKQAIALFKQALPNIEVMTKAEALAKIEETDYAVVIHNNSDAFGQNIETEGPGSMDGVIGSYSDAALVLKRSKPDLLEIVI